MIDVAIVGGGPGGAAAANAILRAAPHLSVQVFERAAQLRRVGFAISLTGNGLSAVEAIGADVHKAVDDSLLPDGPLVRLGSSGREFYRAESTAAILNSGVKTGFVPWHQIQQSLLDLLPPGTLRLGHSLDSLDTSPPDHVTLKFANQPDVHARVVIGCDGNLSTVRKSILGDSPPKFSGRAVWRGQAPLPEAWPYSGNLSSWFIDDPAKGKLIHVVRLRDSYLAWSAYAPWAEERLPELGSGRYIEVQGTRSKEAAAAAAGGDAAAPAPGAKVQRCLRALEGSEWVPPLLDLIKATDESRLTEHGSFYREPEDITAWGKGRVTLLGDAAHLSSALLAQGTNQALEDAVELGRAIGEHGATEEALRRYEAVRIPRACKVHAASVDMMKGNRRGERTEEGKWHQENPWCSGHKLEPLVPAR